MQKTKRTKQILLMLVLLTVTWPFLAFAGEVNLPQTGQTTCYDANGNVIPCPGTGQDGDKQAGVDWPSPRFVDNGDGTVTDQLTGLIWLKDAGCAEAMTWNNAVTYCNNLASGTCGLTDGSVAGDWRLPNIVELESLGNLGILDPPTWLNSQGFTNVSGFPCWSATTFAVDTSYAWVFSPWDSSLGVNDKSTNAGYTYVWPVRGGQNGPAKTWQTGQKQSYAAGDDGTLEQGAAWPSPRFVDNGDGTVTDHLTGLIWLKDANSAGNMAWNQALNFCSNLASETYGLTDGSVAGDWRLPNRKELLSLVDFSRYMPALPQGHPFSNVRSSSVYWSATTYTCLSITSAAWTVSMLNGLAADIFKSASDVYYVWPVRGGQSGSLGNLTIAYPNGGEILTKGNNYTITWNSTNISGDVQIGLYKGGTESSNMVLQLAAATDNDGQYTFNPLSSLADGSDYYIGISAESGAVTDFSNAAFSIESEPAPAGNLTISYPNGGDILTKGSNYTITWNSTNISGKVQVALYKGGMESADMVLQLSAATDNDGQYTFNPSSSLEDGSDYYIGISAESGAVTDFSNSAFSIASVPAPAGDLTISYPNGGETLTKGSNYTITWDSTNISGNVQLALYKGGTEAADMVSELTAATDNDGQYTFNPSSTLADGSDYYIGISAEDGAVTDFSDSAFSIAVAPDPACVSQKLKTAGTLCTALMNCWVKEVKDISHKYAVENFTGVAIQKFGTSWDKAQTAADNKGLDCDTGSSEEIEVMINDALEAIYDSIYSDTDQGNKNSITLGSDLLKAAGKRCGSLLNARSAYIKDKSEQRDAKLNAAIVKADNAFSASFNKAKAKAAKKALSCDDSIKTYLEGVIDDLESDILSSMGVALP